jgi:rare lipoprotein A
MKPTQSFQAMLVILFSLYSLSGCTTTELASSLVKPHSSNGLYKVGQPYVVDGKTYYPSEVASYTEEGQASWYGPGFHGRQTANGEEFDTYDFTAAHRTLPMPSVVRVTNLENGNTILVRINDRGPFKRDRVIDVSQNAAKALGFHQQGTTRVRVEFMPEESRMVAEAAKHNQTMTLAEVQAKMNERQVAAQVPPPMAMASTQVTPVQTENLIPAAEAAEPARYQPASFTPAAAPQTASSAHVLRDPGVHPVAMTANSAKISHKVYVQIGAYENKAHAVAVGKKIAKVAAEKIDVIRRGGVKLYRVRLVASNQTEAQHMLHRVASMGYGDAKLAAE